MQGKGSSGQVWEALAAFPSTYFYVHFRISPKKALDGYGNFLSGKKKCTGNYDGNTFNVINSSMCFKKKVM